MFGRVFSMRPFSVVVVMAFSMVAASGQTSVSVAPVSKNILPSSSLTLSINVSHVPYIHGYRVVVNYDDAILRYDGASPGSFLNGLWFPFVSGPHTLDVANVLIGTDSVMGSGLLFSMQFTAVSLGTSPITISIVELRTVSSGNVSPVTVASGSVRVANRDVIYVNPAYSLGNRHDFGFNAFNVIADGVSAVSTGGTVNIAPGMYDESIVITKNLTLTGEGNPAIQNLTINTPSVTIGGSIQVSGVLTLASGIVTTGSNKITITNDQPDAVVIPSAGGSINGQIQRTIQAANTGTYKFTNTNTYVVPAVSQPATVMSVTSFPNTFPVPAGNNAGAIKRYYSFSSSLPSFTASELRLGYLDPAENPNSVLNSSVGLNVYNTDLDTWTLFPSVGGSESGSFYAKNSNASPVSLWSHWAISDRTIQLPIQLASFTGIHLSDMSVRLNWRTISEINNFGFCVQRKPLTGPSWTELPNSFIAGHGTTNEPQQYTFIDNAPAVGPLQYRLKQMDLDGSTHYSEPVRVDDPTGVAETVPEQFALLQNYPNPFNPSTTIKFQIPSTNRVTVVVYNVLGEKIATLVSEEMPRGSHSVTWMPENLSSGAYLLRLSAGGFIGTRKMLLSK